MSGIGQISNHQNTSTWEKTGAPRTQGYPQVCSTFQTSSDCMKPCITVTNVCPGFFFFLCEDAASAVGAVYRLLTALQLPGAFFNCMIKRAVECTPLLSPSFL